MVNNIQASIESGELTSPELMTVSEAQDLYNFEMNRNNGSSEQ